MNHYGYMHYALTLAQKGLGFVSPNPMVGCVIVKDDKIVAEGYHEKYGEAHAEVNAINNLPPDINPAVCTLYVTLEPCSHFGKTPPCSDLIISKGFKKVVICNVDTNPLVGGKGIEKLKKAGIEVITGICEKEGRFLNRRFFTLHEKNRPYVILKWAQTKDGFISRWPIPDKKEDNWITGTEVKTLVHQMRAEEDAILVGKNTVLNDNPELTTRLVTGKNPLRIVITKEAELDPKLRIFCTDTKTLVFNGKENKIIDNVAWVKLTFDENVIEELLHYLAQNSISSLIVEGGAKTLNSFINKGFWDEMRILVNPNLNFEKGIKAPDIALTSDFQYVGSDHYYAIYSKS